MSRLLIIFGAILVLIGVLWPWLEKVGVGHLPGDIVIRKSGFTFYFPITTCIIASILVSVILWLFHR